MLTAAELERKEYLEMVFNDADDLWRGYSLAHQDRLRSELFDLYAKESARQNSG